MNRQRILQKIRAVSAEGKGIVALYNEISAIVAREAYEDALKYLIGEVGSYCRMRGADFISVRCDTPIEKMLFEELLKVGIME